MATVTNAFAAAPVTTNLANYASPAFTPVVGDLLVAMFAMSDNASADDQTATGSVAPTAFVGIKTSTWPVCRTSLDKLFAFISTSRVLAASSRTVTLGTGSDLATGAIHMVARIAGMPAGDGLTAVRQTAQASNGAAGTAPSITFPAACLTGNPVLFAWMAGGSATATTPPSGFTEQIDSTYITPTTQGGYSSINSGFTGTTITLGSTVAASWAAIGIELAATTGGGGPSPFAGWGIPI